MSTITEEVGAIGTIAGTGMNGVITAKTIDTIATIKAVTTTARKLGEACEI
ncbi:MAG: hypothetical protein KDI13_03940 [Alphaproteobacteria bacterium]|nr:hypothetical protein [Alphaproteobacteria bacterium]